MKLEDYVPETSEEREILKVLRAHDRVTFKDLARLTDVSKWRYTNFVAKLRRLKILYNVDRENGQVVFTVMDLEAAQAFAAQRRNTAPGAIWSAMRSLKTFTAEDLSAAITGEERVIQLDFVKKYCRNLTKAEYLQVIEFARGGKPSRYRLVKDTGPLAPQVRNLECIVDGNTDRLAYVAGARQ